MDTSSLSQNCRIEIGVSLELITLKVYPNDAMMCLVFYDLNISTYLQFPSPSCMLLVQMI